ncbi:MAG: hypothetical protein GF364_09490 [Candidatus Lokiarchaeota archaeon]|nr:hypothetical protein [Candidatus Lokiarchaeota archaeon]
MDQPKMNDFKEKLEQNKKIYGIMIKDFINSAIVPLLIESGYDFIVLDCEHSGGTFSDIQNLAIAAKNTNLQIIVRPASLSYEHIARTLDMGADGLMIPHIDTKKEAEKVIEYAKYPPLGKRGYGMRRYLSKFDSNSSADYKKKANSLTTIFIQIESELGANNIENILDVEAIDGLIIGPADFTLDLGCIGEYNNERFVSLAERVWKTANNKSVSFGIHFSDLNQIKKWSEKGMNILMYSSISNILSDETKDLVQKMKCN